MTDDEIRIAVAEVSDWKFSHMGSDQGMPYPIGENLTTLRRGELPRYTEDLNAMRDAIMAQPVMVQKAMRAEVWRLSDQMTVLPPARVYAEALLRVLGKYKEGAQ